MRYSLNAVSLVAIMALVSNTMGMSVVPDITTLTPIMPIKRLANLAKETPQNAHGISVDGIIEAGYGLALANDPIDPPQSNTNMDLGSLYVTDTVDSVYVAFTINSSLTYTETWGQYIIYVDTTGDGNGAPDDAWGHNVVVTGTHKPEFSLKAWVNQTFGISTTQLQHWNGGWSNVGTATEAAILTDTTSVIEYRLLKSVLDNPSQLWLEVFSTGMITTDNAQDTINTPSDDWNATNWTDTAILLNSTHYVMSHSPAVYTPAIALTQTVGANPAECAPTSEFTLTTGEAATYCFTVANTGNLTLTTHTLTDTIWGDLLTTQTYTLAPGAVFTFTHTATPTTSTVNVGWWTATEGTYTVTAQASATVTVLPPFIPTPAIALTQTVSDNLCVLSSTTLTVTVNDPVHFCLTLHNTGNVTFTQHNLSNTLLGLNTSLSLTLPPNAITTTLIFTYIPTTPGSLTSTTSLIATNGGFTATATATTGLVVQAPEPGILLSPAAFTITQLFNLNTTHTLTIQNTGNTTLTWSLTTTAPVADAQPLALSYPTMLTQNFDSVSAALSAGWVRLNVSQPLGPAIWSQGNTNVFTAHTGISNSYIAVNFQSAGANVTGTISNWLLTPPLLLQNGATLVFWTRSVMTQTYPDRLEVRLSQQGNSVNVGQATSVGDFTKVLTTVNPNLTNGGYPSAWRAYTITLSGITTPTVGRIGFRYFVTNTIVNGNYIGLDTISYAPPPITCALPSWLNVAPQVGSLGKNNAVPVSLHTNSTGLPPTTYTARICIANNAGAVRSVPVTFKVEWLSLYLPMVRR